MSEIEPKLSEHPKTGTQNKADFCYLKVLVRSFLLTKLNLGVLKVPNNLPLFLTELHGTCLLFLLGLTL